MKTIRQFSVITAVILLLTTFTQPASAEISTTGDVDPANPATWTSNTDGYIGKTSNGTMNITGSSAVSSRFGYIGYYSGSTGEVTVDGTGSTWTNGSISIGNLGSGTLNITGSSAVSSGFGYIGYYSGSTGEVTINGTGSTWTNNAYFYVGNQGSGTLNITGGGTLNNSSLTYIGCTSSSTGEVTVDGTGSTWTNGSISIGNLGSGTLNITGGGTVSNKDSSIGHYINSMGEVTVDGTDSTWTNNGQLCVGSNYGGSGTLNITNGGAVSSGGIYQDDGYGYYYFNSYIGGEYGDSTGEVTVDGAGSTWTNKLNLYVSGYSIGVGMLEITNGGLVSVAETLFTSYGDYINMATGGMLALHGQADESLGDFMDLISGADVIRYWDDSASNWADITDATYGVNYTLSYLTEGDLDGYTMLTVTTIPEPTTILLLGLGGLMLRRKKK